MWKVNLGNVFCVLLALEVSLANVVFPYQQFLGGKKEMSAFNFVFFLL